MVNGYAFWHREWLELPIWLESTPEQKVVLMVIIGMVNYKENTWLWHGEEYDVQPGQRITSLDSIVKKCGKGVTVQNVRTALKRFEKLGFLTNESTKQGRLITIVKSDRYPYPLSEANKEINSQLTNDQQTPNNQLTPINKDKKVKKEKKDKNTTQHGDTTEPPKESALSVFDSESNQGIVKALKECSYYHLLADRTEKNAKLINALIGYEKSFKFIDVIDMIIEADAYIAGRPSRYKWSSDNNNATRERRTAGARETMRKRFSNAVMWNKEG